MSLSQNVNIWRGGCGGKGEHNIRIGFVFVLISFIYTKQPTSFIKLM